MPNSFTVYAQGHLNNHMDKVLPRLVPFALFSYHQDAPPLFLFSNQHPLPHMFVLRGQVSSAYSSPGTQALQMVRRQAR